MFKTHVANQHPRSGLAKQAGAALMKASYNRQGDPTYQQDHQPHQIEPFVKAKIAESTKHGAKSATTSTKVKTHFAPQRGR
jgi:hypothetical protein